MPEFEFEDYYFIAEALEGMKDLVPEYPNGAVVAGSGYNGFDLVLDIRKYAPDDSTVLERLEILRKQKLHPAVIAFRHRFALYGYKMNPYALYVWQENKKRFIHLNMKEIYD